LNFLATPQSPHDFTLFYINRTFHNKIPAYVICSQLHSDRDSIPDVPAVYFVLPTEENITRIGQDLQKNLYDAYHLNFTSPISRQRLEDLAELALQANCVNQIQKVYDQYLNFISLEDDLFILRQSEAITGHSPDVLSFYGMYFSQNLF